MPQCGMRRGHLFALPLVALALAAPADAQRSLLWRELSVGARLDADGVLHVRERHAMVFSGDWNGGERRFRIARGQHIELVRLTREDPATRSSREVRRGDLDDLDCYDWAEDDTLRWRSRLPSDPAFASTEIDYVLEYALSHILRRRGDHYVLDHDFAFPDREWPIQRYVLDLEIDAAWRVEGAQQRSFHFEPGALAPGSGFVVKARMVHIGPTAPASVRQPAPLAARLSLLAAIGLAITWWLARFVRQEERPGRWAALPHAALDPASLEANLFSLRPEVAGAVWDRSVGAPEVAAVITRLVAEGKLASTVRPGAGKHSQTPVLELRRLIDGVSLEGYESELVDKLFVDQSEITDTEKVRAYYASSGFDPVEVIREPVMRLVELALGSRPERHRAKWWLPTALSLSALVTLLTAGFLHPFDWPAVGFGALGLALIWGGSAGLAAVVARAVSSLARTLAWGLLALAAASAGYAVLVLSSLPVGMATLVGLGLGLSAVWSSTLALMRSRDRGPALARRRQLAALRLAFRDELRTQQPRLEDAWLPWLVALGLGSQVERWTRSFSVGTADSDLAASSSAWSGGSGGFSGGGGAFGGAGASASWTTAVGALSAGVSAPSSSSDSDSSGGGSSGGGGGGGW